MAKVLEKRFLFHIQQLQREIIHSGVVFLEAW